MTAPFVDDQGRPEPPLAADELGTLLGFLDFQRATLAWKCRGVDQVGLSTRAAASTITLGGLLKHLSLAEDLWFSRWLHGNDRRPPYDEIDWNARPDWDWESAADDSPEELFAMWEDAVARSRALVDEALARGGLEQLTTRAWPNGERPSLRWVIVHMIEEYARHNGHADFLREAWDGETGE